MSDQQILRELESYVAQTLAYLRPCSAGIVVSREGDFAPPRERFYLSPRARNIGTGLYTTTRELNRFGQLWLTEGTFAGHRYFDPSLKREAWKKHGVRAGDGHALTAVVPEANVVVTVTRNRAGPLPAGTPPYVEDKRALVRFGARLGG